MKQFFLANESRVRNDLEIIHWTYLEGIPEFRGPQICVISRGFTMTLPNECCIHPLSLVGLTLVQGKTSTHFRPMVSGLAGFFCLMTLTIEFGTPKTVVLKNHPWTILSTFWILFLNQYIFLKFIVHSTVGNKKPKETQIYIDLITSFVLGMP